MPTPIALYHCNGTDNTAVDSSVNARNAALANVLRGSDVTGGIGYSLYFSDASGVGTIPHDTGLDALGTAGGSFSACAWIYRLNENGFCIFSKPSATSWAVYINDDAGEPSGCIGLFANDDGGATNYRAPSHVPLNAWHHVAVVFDQTNHEIRFYLDGVIDTTTANNGNIVGTMPHRSSQSTKRRFLTLH